MLSGVTKQFSGSEADVNLLWSSITEPCPLGANEIHVWRIGLNISAKCCARLSTFLSPDEATRADRFRFPELRSRYIAGRGALRCILGHSLGLDPQNVCFDYEANGKPVLAHPPTESGTLSFNVSHSHGLALCAITLNRNIGVDLEYLHRTVDVDSIAERFFSLNERAALRSVPADQRRARFFRYWTCKEACIKATGLGVSQLEEFEVELRGADTARLKSPGRWCLYELSPSDDYTAVVAVEGNDHVLQGRSFDFAPI